MELRYEYTFRADIPIFTAVSFTGKPPNSWWWNRISASSVSSKIRFINCVLLYLPEYIPFLPFPAFKKFKVLKRTGYILMYPAVRLNQGNHLSVVEFIQ
jgi:hypothetical protein